MGNEWELWAQWRFNKVVILYYRCFVVAIKNVACVVALIAKRFLLISTKRRERNFYSLINRRTIEFNRGTRWLF